MAQENHPSFRGTLSLFLPISLFLYLFLNSYGLPGITETELHYKRKIHKKLTTEQSNLAERNFSKETTQLSEKTRYDFDALAGKTDSNIPAKVIEEIKEYLFFVGTARLILLFDSEST